MQQSLRNTWRLLALALAYGLLFFTLAQDARAQNSNANPRAFGVGQPVKASDLPPGQLRRSIEQLPPQAEARALRWLQGFSFPVEDIDSLRVNPTGAVYYADYGLARELEGASAANSPGDAIAAALPDQELFSLHSKPGAPNVLFLDFDGHVIQDTQWNLHPSYGTGINPHVALPFDPSGNDSPATVANFTQTERERIHEIWHRIAEDFAPFDIDVTTEEPAVFTPRTGHVLFTHDIDANGNAMPAQGAGGVAWINVFGRSDYVSGFSPALVYYTNLYSNRFGDPSLNAEAGSHEFGHNIGLAHDGLVGGTEYYAGHGSGRVRWGPIMGGSYQDQVTQWSRGEYANASNTDQDDLALIAGDLGYDPDREGDDWSSAVPLLVQSSGNIPVTNPETDPVVYDAAGNPGVNKGIIQDRADEDWWYLDVGAGQLDIVVTPAWHAFNYSPYLTPTYRGANLDIELQLLDGNRNPVDIHEPIDETDAAVSATLAAGRYYLRIRGVGNNVGEGYTDYASIGMYFIEGTVTPAVIDTDPPTPNPMSFAVAPYATGTDSIAMSAQSASDPTGPVQYLFTCVSGGANCGTSGWQTSTAYTATGLDGATTYTYTVRARDALDNQTADSVPASATTDTPPPAVPGNFSAVAVSTSEIDLSWDDVAGETGYELQRSLDGSNYAPLASPAANVTSFSDSGLSPGTRYWYRLRSVNAVGESAWANADDVTTDQPPAAPTDLVVTGTTGSSIALGWTDNSGNESGFQIERSGDGNNWQALTSVSANITSYDDTGLGSLETWHYRVRATNSGGPSAWSNPVSARTDAECSLDMTLSAGETRFFSLPCDPGAENSVGKVFSPLAAIADYGSTWQVYHIDSANRTSYLMEETGGLQPGGVYVIFSAHAAKITFEGSDHTPTIVPITGPEEGRWNFVGYPGATTMDLASLQPGDGVSAQTWTWADRYRQNYRSYVCELPSGHPGLASCNARRIIQIWNGNSFEPVDLTDGTPGQLRPFEIFAVRAHKGGGVAMHFPASSSANTGNPSLPVNNRNEKPTRGSRGNAREWQLELIANAGSLRDRGNLLGLKKGSSDGQDDSDLEELAPISNRYLTVLFENEAFEATGWGYSRDLREPGNGRPQEWTVIVRAAPGLGQITLRWNQRGRVPSSVTLIDDLTGESIRMENRNSLTFTASSSGERRFRIVTD